MKHWFTETLNKETYLNNSIAEEERGEEMGETGIVLDVVRGDTVPVVADE